MSLKKRMCFFLMGVIILTFGLALTIKANLGTGAWDSVNVGLSETFGLSVGTFVVIISIFMMIFAGILRQNKFNFYTFITAVCLGAFTDFWLIQLDTVFSTEDVIVRSIVFIGGVVLLAFGVALYLLPKLAPNPIDDFVVALSENTRLSLGAAKFSLDSIGIILAILLAAPIGVGTFVVTLTMGPLIQLFTTQILKRRLY